MLTTISLVSAFLITLILTPFIRRCALKRELCDHPSPRRIHSVAVPTGGGIAIWVGVVIAVLLFVPWSKQVGGLLLGSSLIVLLGIIDDFKELSPSQKLGGQLLAAILILPFGLQIQFITNPLGGMIFLGFWGLPLTVIWIVGITNTLNFIDGLDGLAGGVAVIAAVTLAIVAWQEGQLIAARLALIVAGSALAFLIFNFYPARIFMGDSGAMFLGFFLANISILGALKSATAMTLLVPVLALGVPIFDTLFAIIRRRKLGHSIASADKDHIHHRLLRLGFSHRNAVLAVYLTSLLLGGAAIYINTRKMGEGFLVSGIVFLIIGLLCHRFRLFAIKDFSSQEISKYIR